MNEITWKASSRLVLTKSTRQIQYCLNACVKSYSSLRRSVPHMHRKRDVKILHFLTDTWKRGVKILQFSLRHLKRGGGGKTLYLPIKDTLLPKLQWKLSKWPKIRVKILHFYQNIIRVKILHELKKGGHNSTIAEKGGQNYTFQVKNRGSKFYMVQKGGSIGWNLPMTFHIVECKIGPSGECKIRRKLQFPKCDHKSGHLFLWQNGDSTDWIY